MTFKTFESLMNRLLEVKEDGNRLCDAFRRFEPDFNCVCFSKYETLLVDAIKAGVNDKNDWVGYFIYEMDCKFSKKSIGKNKTKLLYIRNMKDLYNLI